VLTTGINEIDTSANIALVRAEHPRRLYLFPEPTPAHPVRWLYPLQPVADLRDPELDRRRFLHAVLPAQLQTWILQGLRLHDHGRFRWCKSLRSVHYVLRCVRSCRKVSTFPAVVGQQCQRQLRFVPFFGMMALPDGRYEDIGSASE
jgi:hypothetical protein